MTPVDALALAERDEVGLIGAIERATDAELSALYHAIPAWPPSKSADTVLHHLRRELGARART